MDEVKPQQTGPLSMLNNLAAACAFVVGILARWFWW
jgi:hypothetical protein